MTTATRICHADPDAPYPEPGTVVTLCGHCTKAMAQVTMPQKAPVTDTHRRPVGVLRAPGVAVFQTWQDLREHHFWHGGHPERL